MVVTCSSCESCPAQLRRSHVVAAAAAADSSSGGGGCQQQQALCKSCFVATFEREVDEYVRAERLFERGDVVAVGVSGGKDSAVLLHLLWLLNVRHDYGVRLVMVAVDEGIAGYRDHSLEAVAQQRARYDLELRVLSYRELYGGWTMDRVVGEIGRRGNCTYCGVFRRQALERGAAACGATKLATGHNADDAAETVLMNLLRGDLARLQRCVRPLGRGGGPDENVPRVKPLMSSYEKEIVMYARFQGLTYFATECLYAPNAYRGHARTLIKQYERVRPRAILDILASGEQLARLVADQQQERRTKKAGSGGSGRCSRCGAVSNKGVCHACALREQLDLGSESGSISRTTSSGGKEETTREIEDLVIGGVGVGRGGPSAGGDDEDQGGCRCGGGGRGN